MDTCLFKEAKTPENLETTSHKRLAASTTRQCISTRTRGRMYLHPVLEKLNDVLQEALTSLRRRDRFKIFHNPVDVNAVPEYLNIVEKPMDFSKIESKIQNGEYASFVDFNQDVELIFSNCIRFNACNTIFFKQAVSIGQWWKKTRHSLRQKASSIHQPAPSVAPVNETGTKKIKLFAETISDTSCSNLKQLRAVNYHGSTPRPKPLVKKNKLPYIKCRNKSNWSMSSSATLGDILQYLGEKGVSNCLSQYPSTERFQWLLRHMSDPSKQKLVTLNNLMCPSDTSMSGASRKPPADTVPPEKVYSEYTRSIMSFLGESIGHIVAPRLPCLQQYYFPESSTSSTPPTTKHTAKLQRQSGSTQNEGHEVLTIERGAAPDLTLTEPSPTSTVNIHQTTPPLQQTVSRQDQMWMENSSLPVFFGTQADNGTDDPSAHIAATRQNGNANYTLPNNYIPQRPLWNDKTASSVSPLAHFTPRVYDNVSGLANAMHTVKQFHATHLRGDSGVSTQPSRMPMLQPTQPFQNPRPVVVRSSGHSPSYLYSLNARVAPSNNLVLPHPMPSVNMWRLFPPPSGPT